MTELLWLDTPYTDVETVAISTTTIEYPPRPTFDRDLTSGLWLPNGQPNRCNGVDHADGGDWWCVYPVVPPGMWRTYRLDALRLHVRMSDYAFDAMESGYCPTHRGAES